MSSSLFKAGGALTDAHADTYIERRADRDALNHLHAMDYLLVIEPRQQGKTSLIAQLHSKLASSRYICAYVDVEDLNCESEEAWFTDLWKELSLCAEPILDHAALKPPANCQGWRDQVRSLAQFAEEHSFRIAIALDEVGSIAKVPWAELFFASLRKFYNQRAFVPFCKELTFVLVGAFHPRDLIKDNKISPFNVARRVRLPDFTLAQVQDLVGKGDWPDKQAASLAKRIHDWTDGQPYLTQLLCSYLEPEATPADVDSGVERLRREDENHLPSILERLSLDQKLRRYVERIVAGERIKFYPRENRRQAQLELLGVIKKGAGDFCAIRNRIYEQVLLGYEALGEIDEPIQNESALYLVPEPTFTVSALESPSQSSGKGDMLYERGLQILKAQLERTNRYDEFNVLEARLQENLHDGRVYGPSEQNRSDRARIIDQLNRLALDVLGASFNDLSLGHIFPGMHVSAGTLSLVRELHVDLTPAEVEPPVQPRLHRLPFNQLSWEQFEALCAALIEANSLTIDCHLHGVQGDEQQGIDIVTTQRGANQNEIWAYQCKRYGKYTPGKFKEAMAKLTYQADYYVLMLSIPATAALRGIADEKSNVFLWDANDIARKLKNYPRIVEDFFGNAWRDAFCG